MNTMNVLLIENYVLHAILIKESLERNRELCNINKPLEVKEFLRMFREIKYYRLSLVN